MLILVSLTSSYGPLIVQRITCVMCITYLMKYMRNALLIQCFTQIQRRLAQQRSINHVQYIHNELFHLFQRFLFFLSCKQENVFRFITLKVFISRNDLVYETANIFYTQFNYVTLFRRLSDLFPKCIFYYIQRETFSAVLNNVFLFVYSTQINNAKTFFLISCFLHFFKMSFT